MLITFLLQFFVTIISTVSIVNAQIPNGCFDLGMTQALTFYKDAMTTSARAPPIKQLNCVGGDGCSYSKSISAIQCTNSGLNNQQQPQWKCTAQLPENVDLGTTTVSCEGCTSSTDYYKVTGSCGLFYTLNIANDKTNDDGSTHHIRTNDNSSSVLGIFLVLFVIIFAIICVCLRYQDHQIMNNYTTVSSSPVRVIPMTTTYARPQPVTQPQSYQNNSYQNSYSYTPVPTAPPIYQSTYTNNNTNNNYNNGFAQGLLVGDAMGGGNNNVAEDLLIVNAISGGSNNSGFVNGMLVGSALSSGHHDSTKLHHNKPPKHHNTTTSNHNKASHSSTGFGETVTR
jgi:hypothetical protein